MNKLVIGDEDCSISKVVSTMCSDLGGAILFENWSILALHLETPLLLKRKLKNDFDKNGIVQVVEDLLVDWKSRLKTDATMTALLKIIEHDCKWKAMADDLHREFKMKIGESTRWPDLDSKQQNEILECEVSFLGTSTSLKSLISKLEPTQQNRIYNDALKGPVMLEMLRSGKLVLTREYLPQLPKVYISRTLSTRRKLDPKIFEAECPDIFVVQNISLGKLSEFSGKHRVDRSYRQAEHLTARFISLDSADHFEDICEQAKLNSVHLINFKNVSFDWVKTHGNLHQIQAHLHHDTESIPEADFPNLLDDSQDGFPICIAENPGMGKTLLLANLFQRRRSQNPEKYIIFANFAEIFGLKPGMSLVEYKSTENTWRNIIEHVSDNEVGREILAQVYMTSPNNVELFLDGFDEIPTAQLHLAVNCLKSFATNLKGVQIYATTRVNRQVDLERALGTLSFNILPFSQSDQINFFRDTWNQVYDIPTSPMLEKAASFLVAEMRSKFSSEENDITGVPLQCSMLAEVYQKSAKRNATQSGEPCETSIRINSIHEMYEKLLELRFRTTEDETRRNEVLRMHQMAALELLLPSAFLEHSKKLFKNVPTRSSMQEEVSSVGLLTFGEDSSGGESIRFLHRTYAEFILADSWLSSFHQLSNTSSSISLRTILRKYIGRFRTHDDALIKILLEILEVKGSDAGIKVNNRACTVGYVYEMLCGSENSEKCRQEWVKVARALNFGPEDIADIHGKLKFNSERKDLTESQRDILWLLLWQWTDYEKRQPLLVELVDALYSLGFDDMAVSLESSYYSKSFHHHTLCFFLNTCLEKYQIALNPSTVHDFMILSIGNILKSCMSTGSMNIFRMISRYSLSVKDRPLFQIFYKSQKWTSLLFETMRRSGASQLEECCAFVEEMEGKPLHRIQWEFTPFHVASERGDVSSFLFLLRKFEQCVFGMKALLHHCTVNSLDDSEEVVNGRTEIIDQLLKINSACLEEREPAANRTPILVPKVHLKLLEFLLKKGANARAVDVYGNTLVRQAAICFSPEDFHRLTELLLENGCGDVLLMRDKSGCTELHCRFEWAEMKVETVELIAAHVTKDFNISDSEGTTILGSAVVGLQKLEILETLVKYGADPKRVETDGKTMVHLAALHGHVEAIGYLCSLGCDANAKDFRQRTALHTVVTMGRRNLDQVVMALLQQKIIVNAIDDEGRSALWYAEKMEDFRKLKPVTLNELQDAAGENPTSSVS